ncbi:MAG: hypothetical protein Q8O67_08780 [Deltaproteobacteria bacterium]|nr:hypothetical protein [Deltaproteobacteria bacterium]
MRLLWLPAIALLTAGRCAPGVDDGCPDLADFCPALVCVEQARSDEGCPVCECAVQACLQATDCAERDPPQRCDLGVDVCEPPPACTDGDDDTSCPAACFGRCSPTDPDALFCDVAGDCGDGECRFDNRFCLVDEGRCRGWCVRDGSCDAGFTTARDPNSQICFDFADSCTPPSFSPGCQ